MRISDWSSDVCSSDLINGVRQTVDNLMGFFNVSKEWTNRWRSEEEPGDGRHYGIPQYAPAWGHRRSTLWVEDASYLRIANVRSEERRVGNGCVSTCSSRWSAAH